MVVKNYLGLQKTTNKQSNWNFSDQRHFLLSINTVCTFIPNLLSKDLLSCSNRKPSRSGVSLTYDNLSLAIKRSKNFIVLNLSLSDKFKFWYICIPISSKYMCAPLIKANITLRFRSGCFAVTPATFLTSSMSLTVFQFVYQNFQKHGCWLSEFESGLKTTWRFVYPCISQTL